MKYKFKEEILTTALSIVKPRRTRWAGHVAQMWRGGTHILLVVE
jgi:hypothetical protein